MREFTASIGAQTLAGGSTTSLIAINGTTSPNPNIEVLRIWVGQNANATSAQQRVYMKTFGSSFPNGTAITPAKLKPQDPNVSVLVGASYVSLGLITQNTASEGAGATTIVHEDTFNVLNGWLYVPTPPETRIIPSGQVVTAQPGLAVCLSTVTTATSWSWGLTFREV